MRLLTEWTGLAFYLLGLHLALSGCGSSSPVSNSTTGKGEDTLRGELVLYPRATEIGVIARRTFHDSSGRKVREILYTRKFEKSTAVSDSRAWYEAPAGEEGLRELECIDYKYNADGVLWREERRDPKGGLHRILDHVDDTGKAAFIWRRSDGTREYEILCPGGTRQVHVYYDDTGTEIVGITGSMAPGIDLTRGWGEATNGLACGIGANRNRGPVEGVVINVTVTNRSDQPIIMHSTLGFPQIRVELRDYNGEIISPDNERIQARAARLVEMNPHAEEQSQVLSPGEALLLHSIDLDECYRDLPKGEYSLTVMLCVRTDSVEVQSNLLPIGVESDSPGGMTVSTGN